MNKKVEVLEKFVKEFEDTKFYDHGDMWSIADHLFQTDCEFLGKVVKKISSLGRDDFKHNGSSVNWSKLKVDSKNIGEVFELCYEFAKWWEKTVREEIARDINKGIADGTLTSEKEAQKIAIKYLTKNIVSYKPTMCISDLMVRKPKTTHSEKQYNHPWFEGKMTCTLYTDIWGRTWSRSVGIIKEGVKVRSINGGTYIDELGGMMWNSKDGKEYVCEYRTSLKEHRESTRPETFIG